MPLLRLERVLTSNIVTIYQFSTGWNGVYANPDKDVESSLGAFTWRDSNAEVDLPTTHTLVAHIDLDTDEDPENNIALAIVNAFPEHGNDQTVFDIAEQLIMKIALAHGVTFEPLQQWEKTILDRYDS